MDKRTQDPTEPDWWMASTWFGESNRIKARALTVAAEMLPHFRN